jgi:[acyl-carrier-protein] S-malonyltransferase
MSNNPSQIAFLFPGQGSQSVGMGLELAQEHPLAMQIYQEADSLLGYSLSKIAWEGPEDQLNDTINTQPALFVHSIAILRVIQDLYPSLLPGFVAGHSMGELSALIAAGSLEFDEGLLLVRKRGELMKQAGELSPGGMAAILGLDIESLEIICTAASDDTDIVQIANDNCPGQVVISGASAALDRAMDNAKEAGARKVVRLAVSIAAHSPLMMHAQESFNQTVDSVHFTDPATPIIGNVGAKPLENVKEIKDDLQAQLNSRVRWTETIQLMRTAGISDFIEIGNNSVLSGLLKRIDRKARGISIGNPGDFEKLPPLL